MDLVGTILFLRRLLCRLLLLAMALVIVEAEIEGRSVVVLLGEDSGSIFTKLYQKGL